MKKIYKVLLVCLLCLGIVGCSSKNEKKDPKETNKLLTENNYKVTMNIVGEYKSREILIYSNDNNIMITMWINNEGKLGGISISEFTDYKTYQLYPELNKKGDDVFYDEFSDLEITIDDMAFFAEWYYDLNK